MHFANLSVLLSVLFHPHSQDPIPTLYPKKIAESCWNGILGMRLINRAQEAVKWDPGNEASCEVDC